MAEFDLATHRRRHRRLHHRLGRQRRTRQHQQQTNTELVDMIMEVRDGEGWVAIDAPFGFPTAFCNAVAGWFERDDVGPVEDAVIRRVTDRVVHKRQASLKGRLPGRWGTWPLSAVVERITPTTVRCGRILTDLADRGVPVDRCGRDSRVVEAYPIAALRLWDVPTYDYKKKPEDNEKVLSCLCGRVGIELPSTMHGVPAGQKNDAVDAFVCALVARLASLTSSLDEDSFPSTRRDELGSVDLEIISKEGWIHPPPEGHRLTPSLRQG